MTTPADPAKYGHSWFKKHADAVAEADRRAALTRRRYKVRYEAANAWWNIIETIEKVPR